MSQDRPAAPVSEKRPPDPANPSEITEGEEDHTLPIFRYIPSWMTSFILHVSVVVLLALIPVLVQKKETVNLVASEVGPNVETITEISMDPLEDVSDALEEQSPTDISDPTLQPLNEPMPLEDVSDTVVLSDIMNMGDTGLESEQNLMASAVAGGNEFSGRLERGDSKAARDAGATAATEECVALGLAWLAAHQLPDGSWNFNHQVGPGDRSSPNPGQYDDCPIAATAMCLMAFLGNGQTHQEGEYKIVVSHALNFLMKNQRRVNEFAGSLVDPNHQAGMYSHGLATIALAEAYGMTKDPHLHDAAQAALKYIEYAQDPAGGGWRYSPKEIGDLSVTGWILMGIKSGLMSELEIDRRTTRMANRFLNDVSHDSGARYCYRKGNKDHRPTMTAVGLLCRMYTGWKREHPAIADGCKYLARREPMIGESTDMYYNYYAAQVLRQYGGEEWKEWNNLMAGFLVQTQSREGPTKGSWFFDSGSDYGPATGGRIYCTAMAVMTLEVYYRFLPIYRDAAMEDEFPLD
jgi:hypothetical protein